MTLSRLDIELGFIRSLAHSGFILSGPQLSPEDRRERIRVAIMKAQVHDKPFPIDSSLTYGAAYQKAYNRPCELRRFDRDQNGRAIAPKNLQNLPHDFDDSDDEAEDASVGLL